MGRLFVLFGWLVILVLLGLGMAIVFAIFYPIYRFGRAYNFKVVQLLGRIPLILIGLIPLTLIILALLVVGHWIALSTCPSYAFRYTLGFSPGSETKPMQSSSTGFWMTDCQEIYLQFKTNQNVINKIAGKSFKSVSREDFQDQFQHLNDAGEDWFKPIDAKCTQFYIADPFDDRFSSNLAILCYNESTGICFFRYSEGD